MNDKIQTLIDTLINKSDIETLDIQDEAKLLNKIKQQLPSNFIVIAQTNPTTGDIKGNAQKAYKWIKLAQKLEADAIIFPELYLIGSPVGNFISKYPIIVEDSVDWLKAIARKTNNKTKVIIGFVENENNKNYNTVAVLHNGTIEKTIKKSLIKTNEQYPETNIFELNTLTQQERTIKIGGKTALILIGEPNTNTISTLHNYKDYDYIINCCASCSRNGKEEIKNANISQIARKLNSPIVYINQVGTNDCYSFDGTSRVYDKNGELNTLGKSFEEDFIICDTTKINTTKQVSIQKQIQKEFTLNYEDDLERIYKSTIQSIKDYFQKTGFKRAVLGLSGGLDSTISAVLLADALGASNVYGISMPSKITTIESKNDAQILAQNLGINFAEITIKDMFDSTKAKFDSIFSNVEKNWDCRYQNTFTNDNIQARSRAMILWGIANEFESCLPIATSDKSELYMGYATINGDISGGFAPLADITKTKLFALAKWLNKNRTQQNAIPVSIINKRPGAELAINPKTGKPLLAEEALMPYDFLDEAIWRLENLQQNYNDMLNEEFLYEKTEKEKNNPINKNQKIEWLEKFFRRISTSIYKSTIMPPFPIIDTHSINRTEYYQPIISSKINYKKTDIETKLKELI